MDKDYIEVKIPILDSVDEIKVVETFTQEQLWFVCAIAKAFEKSEQQVKKQKEVIDDYKEDISNLLDIINKNCNELKCTSDEWLVIQKYQDKEVSE